MIRVLSWILALSVQVQDGGKEPTDRLVPAGWEGNPWGPAATRARAEGQIPPIAMTAEMARWDAWGRAVLRDGDLVFRRGDARVLFGYYKFSRFIAEVSGSRFSHVGTVAIENGDPVVYDTTKAGVRRQPFAVWILDNAGPMGVKRLKPEHRGRIEAVVSSLRSTYVAQVPFDYNLSLDDENLYCVEMAEKAFRSAGLTLSEPVRLGDMENASRRPVAILLFLYMSQWTLDQPLSLEQAVFLPGNDRHGIWSSPLLETVYEPPSPGDEAAPSAPGAEGRGPQAKVARESPRPGQPRG